MQRAGALRDVLVFGLAGAALTVGLTLAEYHHHRERRLCGSVEVIYFVIVPEFGETFAACMVERAQQWGATAEVVAATARQAETLKRLYDNPATNAALTFALTFPLGLLASTLAATVLRKR